MKAQPVGAFKVHPFLALPFLSPSKVAFSTGSSSAYIKDSTSRDSGYSNAIQQAWALPAPPPKKIYTHTFRKEKVEVGQPTPALCARWDSPSLWRAPPHTHTHTPIPFFHLLPFTAFHLLPNRQAGRPSVKALLPPLPGTMWRKKEISVTEANSIQYEKPC